MINGGIRKVSTELGQKNQTVTVSIGVHPITTAGQFIQVEFEIENQSEDQLMFVGTDLADSQGRSYSASSDLFLYLDKSKLCVLENLNPNVT